MSDSLSDAEYVYFLQTGYGALAVFAIVVYDYTLTLSREVDLIWKRRWTLVTWLYAISRYYAMILSLFITILSVHTPPMSLMTCTRLSQFTSWSSFVVSLASHGIMVIRIYAMFFKSKVIFVLLLLSFLAVSVCNVVGLIPTSTGKDATTVYADGIFLCGLSSDWNYALFASITRIPSMTFAFLLFALALFGLYKHAMERRLIHGGWSANLWMKLLMTQSTIYFAACVACDAIVIACAWTDNLTLIAFGASLTTLNIYLLAPRLLISFRSYHSRHSRIGSANSSLGLSSRSSIDRDIQLQSFGRDSRTSSVLKLPMGTWEAITG